MVPIVSFASWMARAGTGPQAPAGYTPTHYVNPSHPSASDSNDGTSAALPWATLGRALWGSADRATPNTGAAITAGDTLLVSAGTYYSGYVFDNLDSYFKPVNSGTSGSRINIVADGAAILRPLVQSTGTAQSATSTSITLAAGASASNDAYANWMIEITGGTGVGQRRKIAQEQLNGEGYVTTGSYNGTTKVALVQVAWTTTPDATSTYSLTAPGTVCGVSANDYITWDGFTIYEDNAHWGEGGTVCLNDAYHVWLRNLTIVGTDLQPVYDNHSGIRLEYVYNAIIQNCHISNYYSATAWQTNQHNEACILSYDIHDCIIEHCILDTGYSGIYWKGARGSASSTNNIARLNVINGAYKGLRSSNHTDSLVYQNIFFDCQSCLQGAENNSAVIYNNLCRDSTWGLWNISTYNGFTLYNNAFKRVTNPIRFDSGAGDTVLDHNHYDEFTDFRVSNANVGGFAAWQGLGYDTNGTSGASGFIDEDADYRPDVGSTLLTGGEGGSYPTVRGAYITGEEVIGVEE